MRRSTPGTAGVALRRGRDDLLTHVLDWRRSTVGAAGRLDYQADPELEGALATAARIAPATIGNLRMAGEDGST